ncbi:recombinase family protein [Mucilaginibacter sp. PAMB04274]|uniref:recombinase family protein n=1 Tax=Mucilaginibacter sp. PAMB04274 TaxID=3138568 RepID=UPI0031F61E80
MKTAYLYIRVSTDEQADKGYSQRWQEETLRRYCSINSIQIMEVVMEDHSAKNFIRPAWKQLLTDLKKKKGRINLILFTKWDRFSRNTGDAYGMINTLAKLGIEAQAIEQPLDLSIPENKMMLAFYLAAPEVENDRRALNTFVGMRRARKEGRFMGVAPLGFVNKITGSGKKYIDIKEPEAGIMRWVFEQLAEGQYAADHVRKQANKKGLKCGSAHFWNIIRNPVYCGRIEVAPYKDEERYFAQGQHEGIISEDLFYRVQDVLNGRTKGAWGPKMVSVDKLPLRGLIICPECGRMLTGSSSKGYSTYYTYYHCQSRCKTRYRAEDANDKFEEVLRKLEIKPGRAEIFENELLVLYNAQYRNGNGARKQVLEQISAINVRLGNAKKKYYNEETDVTEYRKYKAECEAEIEKLEARLMELANGAQKIDSLLKKAIGNLQKLILYWNDFDSMGKRRLVNSVFPGKLNFDGSTYRTARLNEVIELIYLNTSDLQAKKKQENEIFSHLPASVAGSRIELPTLGL